MSDFDLIDGAFKIGVIDREGQKLLQQARETRNLFGGHPQSSDPDLIKVVNLINDCNKYVLSKEFPPAIIDISTYLSEMDSATFNKNSLAVKQAFSDLPAIYISELSSRFLAHTAHPIYQVNSETTLNFAHLFYGHYFQKTTDVKSANNLTSI